MAKVITIYVQRNGEISSKAKYLDDSMVLRLNKCFRYRSPFVIIPESDIEKYPKELFSEIKIKKPIIKTEEK